MSAKIVLLSTIKIFAYVVTDFLKNVINQHKIELFRTYFFPPSLIGTVYLTRDTEVF